jgi:hypothetical protein
MTTTKLDAALTYASWGWPVFPLVALRKNPATKDAPLKPKYFISQ